MTLRGVSYIIYIDDNKPLFLRAPQDKRLVNNINILIF